MVVEATSGSGRHKVPAPILPGDQPMSSTSVVEWVGLPLAAKLYRGLPRRRLFEPVDPIHTLKAKLYGATRQRGPTGGTVRGSVEFA